jgi:hypothetical protein
VKALVSSQKFGETGLEFHDAPKPSWFAFSLMICASEGICLAPESLSLMYS